MVSQNRGNYWTKSKSIQKPWSQINLKRNRELGNPVSSSDSFLGDLANIFNPQTSLKVLQRIYQKSSQRLIWIRKMTMTMTKMMMTQQSFNSWRKSWKLHGTDSCSSLKTLSRSNGISSLSFYRFGMPFKFQWHLHSH